jgi:hypothetical protein
MGLILFKDKTVEDKLKVFFSLSDNTKVCFDEI